jgi:hypothetical protein
MPFLDFQNTFFFFVKENLDSMDSLDSYRKNTTLTIIFYIKLFQLLIILKIESAHSKAAKVIHTSNKLVCCMVKFTKFPNYIERKVTPSLGRGFEPTPFCLPGGRDKARQILSESVR